MSTRRFLRSKCLTGTPWFQVKLTRPSSLFRCAVVSLGEGEECRSFTCSRTARVFFFCGCFCQRCILLGGFSIPLPLLSCSSVCSSGYWKHWKRPHIVCIGSCAEDSHLTQEKSKQHLQDQRGLIDAETCKKKASQRDIDATNGKDRLQQLEKLSHLPSVLKEFHNAAGFGSQCCAQFCDSGHGHLRGVCGAVHPIALRLICCCDGPTGRSSMRNNNPWDHFSLPRTKNCIGNTDKTQFPQMV